MSVVATEKVAMDICPLIGDDNYSKKIFVQRILIEGYKILLRKVIPSSKTIKINTQVYKAGDNLAVDLPPDFEYYTKVGICTGGVIHLLGMNDELCSHEGRTFCEEDLSTSKIPFFNVHWGGNYYGELYGLPGGYTDNGYYKFETDGVGNNRLLLRSVPLDSDILIEYKSNNDGFEVVEQAAVPALQEYFFWRYEKGNRFRGSGSGGKTGEFKNDFRTEYNSLQDYYNTLTATEYRDIMLRHVFSGVKR